MTSKEKQGLALAVVLLGIGAAFAYFGTKSAGPVRMKQYTELRIGPLQEHLVTKEQLDLVTPPSGTAVRTYSRLHYPSKVCPGITGIINNGFAPKWDVNDPQIMAMPGESAW